MMDALKLDYYAKARPVWVGMLVLALGVALALAAGWQLAAQSRQISETQAQLARMARRHPEPVKAPRKEGVEANVQQVREANAVLARIGLPWDALFEAIESIKDEDVALLELKPDVQKGVVHISAEAKNLNSQLAYLSALQENPLFRDVSLQSHQIYDQDPQNPVRFMLLAGWRNAH